VRRRLFTTEFPSFDFYGAHFIRSIIHRYDE